MASLVFIFVPMCVRQTAQLSKTFPFLLFHSQNSVTVEQKANS